MYLDSNEVIKCLGHNYTKNIIKLLWDNILVYEEHYVYYEFIGVEYYSIFTTNMNKICNKGMKYCNLAVLPKFSQV